ncbi:MAG: hypothetical protein MJE63_08510 [Proteobacteria bacterium]|nr:hypothetical protein [Pseudomonadota bacterium]
MKRSVIILDKDQDKVAGLSTHIMHQGFVPIPKHSLESLQELLESENPMALIIDIDSFPLDTKSLRYLKRKSPDTFLLLISATNAHPDLKEAMEHCVYACMPKPLDLDEVDFWLKSILNDVS